MKKLLLILLCFPIIGFGQFNFKTYVPDDNFEQALIDLGYDNVLDDSVLTSNINGVASLSVADEGISDLTGIEDFIGLVSLECEDNSLTFLDLSNNSNLVDLICAENPISYLNMNNGNNSNILRFWSLLCFNLTCIEVDDPIWSTNNWISSPQSYFWFEPQHYFSNNCPPSAIEEHTTNKELLKVTDLLGRETKQTNQPLFYIYDDGTVEKRTTIE
jgi:hypothetical protein